jgi:5-formyltetrahydrofolate cyclo-ligase
MLYYPFGGEIDLLRLAQKSPEKCFYMPKVLPGCRMKPVVYVPGCPMTPDKYGIPEPEGEGADPAIIDLVLLPAIACDAFGNRVGFGAGCYDRFLSAHAP